MLHLFRRFDPKKLQTNLEHRSCTVAQEKTRLSQIIIFCLDNWAVMVKFIECLCNFNEVVRKHAWTHVSRRVVDDTWESGKQRDKMFLVSIAEKFKFHA